VGASGGKSRDDLCLSDFMLGKPLVYHRQSSAAYARQAIEGARESEPLRLSPKSTKAVRIKETQREVRNRNSRRATWPVAERGPANRLSKVAGRQISGFDLTDGQKENLVDGG